MKKRLVLLCVLTAIIGFSGTSNAALTTIGTADYDGDGNGTTETYNLIYEDNSVYGGLVWLDYRTNVSQGGDWQSLVNWASGLGGNLTIDLDPNYTTTIDWSTGWRLPSAGENPQAGFDQDMSEMGHLYYVSMGKPAGGPLGDTSPFNQLQPSYYWSGTTVSSNPAFAWIFSFGNGRQESDSKALGYYFATAVRPGEVEVVPIPGAVWLLGTGLAAMVGLKRKFKK